MIRDKSERHNNFETFNKTPPNSKPAIVLVYVYSHLTYKHDIVLNLFMASQIDTLISKCRSWDEFVELVNALPKTKNKGKGDLFERLTQVYLQTQPTYRSKLKNVYLLSDKTIPERLRTKLNLPDNDEGIDLVCETYSGEYWSVQCKYKSDQSTALTYKELSTFNSLSFNACKGISLGLVAHTSTKPVKKSHLMPMVNEIGLEKWLEISDADWKQIIRVCRSNTLKPPKKRAPRRHQKAAIADAHNHFVTKKQRRGKLIMPCGTGKSLTAYWIAQALEAKTIVVAVPSLALVRQSLADWTAEYLAEGITPDWLAVCSDHSVGSMGDADSTVATAYEMGIPTNPSDEELDDFLKKCSKAPKIVFTTYQSAEKLCDASRRNNKTFDLLIADEAHKTVGRKSKSFATLLFDENIKVKRRLFMTATERVYNASRDDVISMDDPNIYGSTCHQLSFKEAIKQKIICDYKIVTIAVSDAEINTLIQEKADLSVSAGNKTIDTDAHSLAAGIAMQKAFEKYGIKHAITFHSSIKRAEEFRRQQEDLPNNAHISHSHISSKLSAGQRAKLLKGFANEERSLVTNARCLTEGVDIKAIDCVAFIDPKQSTIDIVQAAGRAMRQSEETGKQCGYIILPIIVPKGATIEEMQKTNEFRNVARIVASLSTQDERIVEEFRVTNKKYKQTSNKILNIDVDIYDAESFEFDKVEKTLSTVIWSQVGRANWRTFDQAGEFVRTLNIKSAKAYYKHCRNNSDWPPDVPATPDRVYASQGWKNWGHWLGTNRVASRKRNYLSYESARKLVRSIKLLSETEWVNYKKSNLLPEGVPSSPKTVYKNNGWQGMGDWLGTGNIAPQNTPLRDFKSARKFVRQLGLQSVAAWNIWAKSGNRPADIPSAANQRYADKGWTSWGDFLGSGRIASGKEDFCDIETAKEFLAQNGIKTERDWLEFVKAGKKPEHLPAILDGFYKRRGTWKSWDDFFNREGHKTFEEVQDFVHSLGIKTSTEWFEYCKKNELPEGIPKSIHYVYRNSGWNGWADFLGKGK